MTRSLHVVFLLFLVESCLLSDSLALGYGDVDSHPAPSPPGSAGCIPLTTLPFGWEPLKLAGKRWVYMNYKGTPTQIPRAKNPVNWYFPLGTSNGTNTTKGSIDGTPGGWAFNFTATLRPGPDFKCGGVFQAGIFTTNGEKNLYAWPTVFGISRPVFYTEKILYTDDFNLEVWFQCYESDPVRNLCTLPYVEVSIAFNPNTVGDVEKAKLTAQVDLVMSKYCLSSANFTVCEHDDSLPDCQNLDQTQPDDFINHVNALRKWLPAI